MNQGKLEVVKQEMARVNVEILGISVMTFCLFILFLGFSRQEYQSGLPFPSPVDHVSSELSTMTHPSWVALNGMAHSFIELDKAVVHVISLVYSGSTSK